MEQLLKEIEEGYKLITTNPPYYFDKGKGTKGYCVDRIRVLRSQLLEMQREIERYNDEYYKKSEEK